MSKVVNVFRRLSVLIEAPGLCFHCSPPAYMSTENNVPIYYFLSEARLCASDPVPCFIQDCVKSESLCKPGNGHHWLRLVSSSVKSRN